MPTNQPAHPSTHCQKTQFPESAPLRAGPSKPTREGYAAASLPHRSFLLWQYLPCPSWSVTHRTVALETCLGRRLLPWTRFPGPSWVLPSLPSRLVQERAWPMKRPSCSPTPGAPQPATSLSHLGIHKSPCL